MQKKKKKVQHAEQEKHPSRNKEKNRHGEIIRD